ncbi:MAG: sigma 54-interacting transcriptional regulator [Deltaproteobacteria bacterium]|nr:sigma 54-interacting transcriptional regulator [Deltaproteobacteria bacterium]
MRRTADSTVHAGEALDGPLRILLIAPDGVSAHPIQGRSELKLGRSEANELRVDDPEISREHLVLRFGTSVGVEDLGSANGTRVRGKPIRAGVLVELGPGDLVEAGSTIVILQRASAAVPLRRRLLPHSAFEHRLDEACLHRGRDAEFTILRIHVEAGGVESVERALTEPIGARDLIASYAPGEYELIAFDSGSGNRVAEEIEQRLDAAKIEHRVGLAAFPRDGTTPEELIEKACAALRGGRSVDSEPSDIIVEAESMKNLYRLIDRVARGNISVLLLGQTGVGKEVVAERLHLASPRRERPFLRLNCAALSDSLFESELFGYEKGAFTGATSPKKGLLENADGGTVFLDELGEMPIHIQAKLLRVIEQKKVMRVGGLEARDIDVRFVSATNRNLEDAASEGAFRSDLYFRLNGVTLDIPPLAERREEIEGLARFFVAKACKDMGFTKAPTITPRALVRLLEYAWPGNIRELRNMMERAVLLASDDRIDLEHLPIDKLSTAWRPAAKPDPLELEPLEDERAKIQAAIERCGGNQSRAAELLGFSRRTLSKKLDKHQLPRPLKDARRP